MELPLRLAVATAGLAFLLLLASLTGNGIGPFGIHGLRHPVWSYIILGAAMAIVLALTPPRKQETEAEADEVASTA